MVESDAGLYQCYFPYSAVLFLALLKKGCPHMLELLHAGRKLGEFNENISIRC